MKTIMVVDDCDAVRSVTVLILESGGYRVVEACDGRQALSRLEEAAVDIVVSDFDMPNMDGISLIRAMKELPAYRAIPILILSSETGEQKQREAKDAGAADWLAKPVHPVRMFRAIAELRHA